MRRAHPNRPPVDREGEQGASLITSVFGVGIFLTFLLFSVQVVLYLYTASIVQAAAIDGANHGAGGSQEGSQVAAEQRVDAVLGGLADTAAVSSSVRGDASGQVLRVEVQVRMPSLLGSFGFGTINRGAESRVEQ